MILKNIDALIGPRLRHTRRTTLHMSGQKFSRITTRTRKHTVDCDGLVAIPGLINAHTHIGDSVAKDLGAGKDAAWRIHPVYGAKRRVLESTNTMRLARYMRRAAQSMLWCGTTTFVDFREGGLDGVALLRRALVRQPIRPIVLGRLECYDSPSRVRANAAPDTQRHADAGKLVKMCDGIGISGANENSDASLRAYSHLPKLRAIHAAETTHGESFSKRNTQRSEVQRALLVRPHFVIHMTQATPAQMKSVARRTRGVVVCPRANASLAEGAPDIAALVRSGCNVALGTDNVMLNSPSMFSEMDYAWKTSMARTRTPLRARDILCMATVNAGRMLRRNIGAISPGMDADCVIIDMSDIDIEPACDIHAAIVSRATSRAVRAVIIGGELVHGRI